MSSTGSNKETLPWSELRTSRRENHKPHSLSATTQGPGGGPWSPGQWEATLGCGQGGLHSRSMCWGRKWGRRKTVQPVCSTAQTRVQLGGRHPSHCPVHPPGAPQHQLQHQAPRFRTGRHPGFLQLPSGSSDSWADPGKPAAQEGSVQRLEGQATAAAHGVLGLLARGLGCGLSLRPLPVPGPYDALFQREISYCRGVQCGAHATDSGPSTTAELHLHQPGCVT